MVKLPLSPPKTGPPLYDRHYPFKKPASIVYNLGSCRNPEQSEALVDVQNIGQVPSFVTKDGSEIRELLAHRNSCLRHQSLAEARLPPGASTTPHHHRLTEEIYYILEGSGDMRVAGETRPVVPGDAIAIPPGATHQVTNTGSTVLKFLCCCAPAYEHEDTILTPADGNLPVCRP